MRFLRLILFIALFSFVLSPTTAYADTARSWYTTRCGNKQPPLPSDIDNLSEYNAYYLNSSLGDGSDRRVIYITFDAGYENGNVEKILDILKAEDVPAAFFVLDNIILKNTEIVKRMGDEGHLVCNHTKNHKDMTKCSYEEMRKNLTDLEKIYEEKTGRVMAKYFRFPEGRYDEKSMRCASELGYATIFWSFAYEDWDNARQPSEEKSIKKILDNTHNGEVILLHPTSETNVKILPCLIKEWRARGYTFGTLDELVADVQPQPR